MVSLFANSSAQQHIVICNDSTGSSSSAKILHPSLAVLLDFVLHNAPVLCSCFDPFRQELVSVAAHPQNTHGCVIKTWSFTQTHSDTHELQVLCSRKLTVDTFKLTSIDWVRGSDDHTDVPLLVARTSAGQVVLLDQSTLEVVFDSGASASPTAVAGQSTASIEHIAGFAHQRQISTIGVATERERIFVVRNSVYCRCFAECGCVAVKVLLTARVPHVLRRKLSICVSNGRYPHHIRCVYRDTKMAILRRGESL